MVSPVFARRGGLAGGASSVAHYLMAATLACRAHYKGWRQRGRSDELKLLTLNYSCCCRDRSSLRPPGGDPARLLVVADCVTFCYWSSYHGCLYISLVLYDVTWGFCSTCFTITSINWLTVLFNTSFCPRLHQRIARLLRFWKKGTVRPAIFFTTFICLS